jgi:hypothetical protein
MVIAQSDRAKLSLLLEEIASLLSPGMTHHTSTI